MTTTHRQRWPAGSCLAACLVAAGLVLLAAPGARAQGQQAGPTVAGRVTDARTGQTLPGTTVEVLGTRLSASTGPDGRYRITGVPQGSQVLVARRIGYAALRQTITVAAGQPATVDFRLEAAAFSLEEVVVTGTAGGEQRRSLGNSVAVMDAGTDR